MSQETLISLSVYSILNNMNADQPITHFGFLCEWPTICGAKKHRHGRNGILGYFKTLFKQNIKHKIYPCDKTLAMMTNICSKYV